MLANHKDNRFLLGNNLVSVDRGSLITSELKLMERWGWSKTKVRAFLSLLESDSMITRKVDNKKTTITIVNYSVYQNSQTVENNGSNNEKEPIKDLTQTKKRPQKDTNNNVNNENNVNKKDIVRHKYGEYNNVLLSDEELKKLQEEYPTQYTAKLEALSEYMKSTGKSYKDHYATIRNWIRREGGAQHGNNSDIGTGEKGKTFNLEDYL